MLTLASNGKTPQPTNCISLFDKQTLNRCAQCVSARAESGIQQLASNRKTPQPAIRIPIFANLAAEPGHPKCVVTPKAGFQIGFESQNTAACDPHPDIANLAAEPTHPKCDVTPTAGFRIGFESQKTVACDPSSAFANIAAEPGHPKCVFAPTAGFPFGFTSQNTKGCDPYSDLCQTRRGTGTSEVCRHPDGGIPNWLRIAKHRSLQSVFRSVPNSPRNRDIRSATSPRRRDSELASNRKTPQPAIRSPIIANLASEPPYPKCVFTPMAEFRIGFKSQNTAACNLYSDLCQPRHGTETLEVRLHSDGRIQNGFEW